LAVLQRIRCPGTVGRPGRRPDRVLADKAYSSKANPTPTPDQVHDPIKDDQAANRRKLASKGGHPPISRINNAPGQYT
jgi:hypothetical protein